MSAESLASAMAQASPGPFSTIEVRSRPPILTAVGLAPRVQLSRFQAPVPDQLSP